MQKSLLILPENIDIKKLEYKINEALSSHDSGATVIDIEEKENNKYEFILNTLNQYSSDEDGYPMHEYVFLNVSHHINEENPYKNLFNANSITCIEVDTTDHSYDILQSIGKSIGGVFVKDINEFKSHKKNKCPEL